MQPPAAEPPQRQDPELLERRRKVLAEWMYWADQAESGALTLEEESPAEIEERAPLRVRRRKRRVRED